MPESRFRQIVEDLLNIEVNTIVKSEMSALKLPASRRYAFYELSRGYHLKLVALGVRQPIYWTFAGLRSFEELQQRAKTALKDLEKKLTCDSSDDQGPLYEKLSMLERIEGQSSQMAAVFRNLEQKAQGKTGYNPAPEPRAIEDLQNTKPLDPASEHRDSEMWNNDIEKSRMEGVADLDLTPDQIGRLRKAWEVGTERIYLQTVIQIDGDVTTRIAEIFLKNPNPMILKIHHEAVATSTRFWQNLVKTLRELAGDVVKGVFG